MPDRSQVTESNATASAKTSARGALSRPQILETALRPVDEHGLEALSMRRLGTELGVEAMSLYNHVQCKDDLLDGLVELLWKEVQLPPEDISDWRAGVRSTIDSQRRLVYVHPNVYPLLLTRGAYSTAALRVFDALFRKLLEAGFDRELAAEALRTVVAYGMGYATAELSCGLCQPESSAACRVQEELSKVPPRFAEIARVLAECESDAQFNIGLETILDGLEARLRPQDSGRPGR